MDMGLTEKKNRTEKTLLRSIANYILESVGTPANLAQAIEDFPILLVQPGADTQHNGVSVNSISAGDIVRWDRLGYTFRGRSGVVNGWEVVGGRYQGDNIHLEALKSFGKEEESEDWTCDIKEVFGLSSSKSNLKLFTSMDAMVETNSREMIEPVTEEKMLKNLEHGEIRILRDCREDFFAVYEWDGRIFLMNTGGSHHFAAARYIAGKLSLPVPLAGRLVKRSINAESLSLLLQDFEMLLISNEPSAYCAFHDAMRSFLANYFWIEAPQGFCHNSRIILLPRDKPRSVKVTSLLLNAGAFDVGEHLRKMVGKQEQHSTPS